MTIRLFSPTLTHRLFDPMPLPRRMTMRRRTSAVMQHSMVVPAVFKRTVKKILPRRKAS